MAINKEKKIILIKEYTESIQSSNSMFFIDTQGLSVPVISELKEKLKDIDAKYILVKNTLFKKALNDSGSKVTSIKDKLFGYNAVVFSQENANLVALNLVKFAKDNDIKINFGTLEEIVLSNEDVVKLSNVPNKEVSVLHIISVINSGMQNLHFALSYNIQKLINVIDVIKDAKEVK
jgi:ribosomal protein L10